MKVKKFLIPFILFSLLSLCSCQNISYRDDISCKELTDAAKNISEKEYRSYGEDYLEYLLNDPSYCDDYSVIYSSEANDIDELGIFHAKNKEDAKILFDMLKKHVDAMKKEQRAFIASYAASELPKLDSAKVGQFGNYVVYSISDEETAEKISSAITSALNE